MPAKKSRQNGALDRRHDSGLIAPGKKVARQRSSTALNGHANGRPIASSPLSPPHDANREPLSRANSDLAQYEADSPSGSHLFGHSSQSSLEGTGSRDPQQGLYNGTMERHTGLGDMANNLHSVTNGSGAREDHSQTLLTDAVTPVIGPHCRLDIFAILLLLLQLPPWLQLLVQGLFSFMTIGNTSASWHSMSMPSLLEWSRSHGGNPSLLVSFIADSGFFCVWALLPWGKEFVLELAPAVMAISLGGGAASKDSWRHATFCTAVVFFCNIFRDKHHRQRLFNHSWTLMSKLSLSPLPLPNTLPFLPQHSKDVFSWWHPLLTATEIHIVTQGGLRSIRRYIDNHANHATMSKSDHEPTTHNPPNPVPPDIAIEGQSNGATDGRPPGPSPAAREKTVSSGKRRKKYAMLVRSQQPFWAAIANTKVNHSGKIESNQAERDRGEAGATDLQHLGDSGCSQNPAQDAMDKVWLTNVEDTEIWFSAVLTAAHGGLDEYEPAPEEERRGSLEPRVLDVCVNGAYWTSVDLADHLADVSQAEKLIEGKIFGLTPLTSYYVQIIRSEDHNVIYSTSLSTRSVASFDDQARDVALQSQDPLRPSSPASTLKKSIVTAESKLADHKNRSNKTRRTHQHAIRSLRQDVSDLKRHLETYVADERQKNRKLQFQKNIEHHDEAATTLAHELANLGDIPQADHDAFEASKARHFAASKRVNNLKQTLEASKRDAARAYQAAHADNAKVRGRREKSEGRLTSLNERHKGTVEEIELKRNAKALHEFTIDQQRRQEHDLVLSLTTSINQRQDWESKIVELQQQRQYYYDNPFVPQYGQPGSPHTPENSYATVNTRGTPVLGYQSTMNNSNPHSRQSSGRTRTPRGRSSSMLSNISGFTDDEASDPAYDDGSAVPRNGSGSSGGTSSQRDPTSPPAPRLSPIGTEIARGSPRQSR